MKEIEFHYSYGYWHLSINGYHNPDVCPECIEKGTLGPALTLLPLDHTTKEEKE